MNDIFTYCPHKESVDACCVKCSQFLCKKCQMESHYDHIESINGLDSIFTEAIKNYSQMNGVLDKILNKSAQSAKEGSIDETLLGVDKRISEQYDGLYKDIKDIENDQVGLVKGSTILGKLQSDKEDLEGDDLKKLAAFDKKLDSTIAQLLSALNSDKSENVENLLDPKVKEEFAKEAHQFDPYYDKQRQFLKKLEEAKSIKPQISYKAQTIEDLVQVKGVHEEIIKLFIYDSASHSVYVELPKTKNMLKYDVGNMKLPKKFAQCVVEDQTLFLCGGKKKPKSYSKNSYTYSEVDGKLIAKADMQEERAYHGIVSNKSLEIYVLCGENGNGLLKSAEVYDVKKNSWRSLPELSEEKKNVAACICGEKYLYVIGGFSAKELATIEMMNIIDNKGWEQKQLSGAFCIQKAGAISIADNQILLLGGKNAQLKSDLCYIIDLTLGNTTLKTNLPSACCFNKSDIRKIEGKIYATGNKKGISYIYDILGNQWTLMQEKDYMLKYNWD